MMKVLDFGSLNYDYVYSVPHAAAPGETVSSTQMNVFCGGKGLNQAVAMARAGVDVMLAGQVGEDGQTLLELCSTSGIDASHVRRVPGKSGHAIIQVDDHAQNCILLYGGSNRTITRESVDQVLSDFGKDDLLLLQNEISQLDYIIDRAFEKGMKIILNPSPYDEALAHCDLTKVSVFLLNEIEGGQITGQTEPEQIMEAMMKLFPASVIVLTLGGDGVLCYDQQAVYRQPIFQVMAVDTTAAGDTFTGYFIAALLRQMPTQEALALCAKAAAITVSREGATTSIPTMAEVESTVL